MRRFIIGFLSLALVGCGLFAPPKPPPAPPGPGPQPTPIPTPPEPPKPTGRVLTTVEYDGVALGSLGTDLLAAFGEPLARNPVGAPGTLAWLYMAVGPHGESLVAEFWIQGGRITNKNRL